MSSRSSERQVNFRRPFGLSGVDGKLPPGTYLVIADEERVEGLSLVAWRQVRTLMALPAVSSQSNRRELIPVDSDELRGALAADTLEMPS